MRIPHWRKPIGNRSRPDIFNWGWGPALGSIAAFVFWLLMANHLFGVGPDDWAFVLIWLAYWGPVIALGHRRLDRSDADRA